jgi:hypothetical protein
MGLIRLLSRDVVPPLAMCRRHVHVADGYVMTVPTCARDRASGNSSVATTHNRGSVLADRRPPGKRVCSPALRTRRSGTRRWSPSPLARPAPC